MDLARFIRGRVDAGESNATIAKRLAVDQTTIAHHLTLLALPPALDAAMREGRCTSPRTLHELSKVHDEHPGQVGALLTGDGPITRDAVAALRASQLSTSAFGAAATPPARHTDTDAAALICRQAHGLCSKLDVAIKRLVQPGPTLASPDELASLRQRLAELAHRLSN